MTFMRLGIVYEGDQTLGFFQRRSASLDNHIVRPCTGRNWWDCIQFFTVFSDPRLENTERVHPLAELRAKERSIRAK